MPNAHPLDIELETLTLIPNSIATEYRVVPKSAGDGFLTLYCLPELEDDFDKISSLEFLLETAIKFIAVESAPLEANISKYYSTERPIRNCPIKLSFECPKTWESLTPTNDPRVKNCAQCSRLVHLCSSLAEVERRGAIGECISYDAPNSRMVLGGIWTENRANQGALRPSVIEEPAY